MAFANSGTRKVVLQLTVIAAVCLAWPLRLGAHDNPYPFDYDPMLSESPEAIIDDLEELAAGLPGLPDELVEIEMDGILFNYYPETLDMIRRARDSGPEIAPPIERIAERCAVHEAFTLPSILIQPASASCEAAGQSVNAAFDGSFKSCQEVEYPEVYVFDHPPGVVELGDRGTLSTLEGQIALIGEALSHLEYPVRLIPESFWPIARSVIAKVRYQKLSDNIDARLASYGQALERLQSSASCFDAGASTALQSAIGALVDELTAVGQQLDQLYADGLAQAAQDRLAVENQGRLRNDLPFPALTDREREMLAFYLTAVYWRMRGGGLIRNPDNGDIPDGAYVTNTFERIAEFAGGLADPGRVGFLYYVDENWGYQEWWDMGNEPGHDQYYDLLWMTDRGKRGVNLVKRNIGDLGYDTKDLIAGSLIMGPCYYYMWYELWSRNGRFFQLGEELVEPYYTFLEMPVSSGEVCYGSSLGLGLARTLLWGRPDTECQPSCVGRECGTDGCGGDCGPCSGEQICSSAGQCVLPGVDGGTAPDADTDTDAAVSSPDAWQPGSDAAMVQTDASMGEVDVAVSDLGAGGPDRAVVAGADAGRSDSSAVPAGGGDSAPGCDGCGALLLHDLTAVLFVGLAVLAAAVRRRRR